MPFIPGGPVYNNSKNGVQVAFGAQGKEAERTLPDGQVQTFFKNQSGQFVDPSTGGVINQTQNGYSFQVMHE